MPLALRLELAVCTASLPILVRAPSENSFSAFIHMFNPSLWFADTD
jgi:hypothetical protein